MSLVFSSFTCYAKVETNYCSFGSLVDSDLLQPNYGSPLSSKDFLKPGSSLSFFTSAFVSALLDRSFTYLCTSSEFPSSK